MILKAPSVGPFLFCILFQLLGTLRFLFCCGCPVLSCPVLSCPVLCGDDAPAVPVGSSPLPLHGGELSALLRHVCSLCGGESTVVYEWVLILCRLVQVRMHTVHLVEKCSLHRTAGCPAGPQTPECLHVSTYCISTQTPVYVQSCILHDHNTTLQISTYYISTQTPVALLCLQAAAEPLLSAPPVSLHSWWQPAGFLMSCEVQYIFLLYLAENISMVK